MSVGPSICLTRGLCLIGVVTVTSDHFVVECGVRIVRECASYLKIWGNSYITWICNYSQYVRQTDADRDQWPLDWLFT